MIGTEYRNTSKVPLRDVRNVKIPGALQDEKAVAGNTRIIAALGGNERVS